MRRLIAAVFQNPLAVLARDHGEGGDHAVKLLLKELPVPVLERGGIGRDGGKNAVGVHARLGKIVRQLRRAGRTGKRAARRAGEIVPAHVVKQGVEPVNSSAAEAVRDRGKDLLCHAPERVGVGAAVGRERADEAEIGIVQVDHALGAVVEAQRGVVKIVRRLGMLPFIVHAGDVLIRRGGHEAGGIVPAVQLKAHLGNGVFTLDNKIVVHKTALRQTHGRAEAREDLDLRGLFLGIGQADGRLVRRRGGAAAARKQRKRKQQTKDFCDVFHVVSPFYMGTSRPFWGGAARFRLCMIASLSVFFNSFSPKQRFFKKRA